jgi:hypothetical protein
MSKTLTEAQVTTANARSRLGLGVHWRRLDAEAHLGYRKGNRGGVWFVRWRNHHEGGNYKQVPVGVANDINDKPAAGILTFEQAVRTAREAVARARTEAASQAAGPAPTVRSAVESYVRERDARERRRTGRDVRSDAGTKLRRYVLGQEKRGNQEAVEPAPLASVHLHALKEDDLITWRDALPEDLKVTTKQRFVNDLKAALNAAWPRLSADRKQLNPTFLAIVKAGFKAERIDDDDDVSVARDSQILTDEEGNLGAITSDIFKSGFCRDRNRACATRTECQTSIGPKRSAPTTTFCCVSIWCASTMKQPKNVPLNWWRDTPSNCGKAKSFWLVSSHCSNAASVAGQPIQP